MPDSCNIKADCTMYHYWLIGLRHRKAGLILVISFGRWRSRRCSVTWQWRPWWSLVCKHTHTHRLSNNISSQRSSSLR